MILFVIFDEKKNSDRGLIFLHFFRLTCHWNVYCYLWCRREKLLPMVSFFLPLVLLPLVQFSNQRQEFLPMVHSCLWCCNNRKQVSLNLTRRTKSCVLMNSIYLLSNCGYNKWNYNPFTYVSNFEPRRIGQKCGMVCVGGGSSGNGNLATNKQIMTLACSSRGAGKFADRL